MGETNYFDEIGDFIAGTSSTTVQTTEVEKSDDKTLQYVMGGVLVVIILGIIFYFTTKK